MTLKSEVLPAPLGPMTAKSWPGWTANETSASAVTPAKRTVSPSTASSGAWALVGVRIWAGVAVMSLKRPPPFRPGGAQRGEAAQLLLLVQAKVELAHAAVAREI